MSEQRTSEERVKSAPQMPATAVHAELRKPNKHAVFVRIKVMDSKGDTYYFDAASFHYDLKHPEEVGEKP
jgi:hypothetical protein